MEIPVAALRQPLVQQPAENGQQEGIQQQEAVKRQHP